MNTHDDDLGFTSIAELAPMLEGRTLSPVELCEALLRRIERYEPLLSAFITQTAERALNAARDAENAMARGEYRGSLHGIPFGLKDIYETAGIPTTAQSKVFRDYVPTTDATTTARLHDAGGVLFGKLTTHEFAHGGPSFDLPWPPARKPWGGDHVTGGSSSGSAAAVAGGFMPVALGSDTGGSIRGPAGLCGLVGLKPTYGLVSRHGIIANSYSYDHAGPLVRTVEDAAIVLQALAGFDPKDPASANIDIPDYRASINGEIRGLRIGIIRHFFEGDQAVASDVHAAMEDAIAVFQRLGATVEDVQLRPLEMYQDVKVTQAEPEVFSIHQHDLRSRLTDYGEDFLGRVLPARLITAADYLRASRARRRLVAEMAPIYDRFDALLTVGPGPAAKFGRWRVIEFWNKGSITAPFNVTGGPALVQCMGFTADGMPLSLQLAGRPFDEDTVLRLAHAYERETQWLRRRPTLDGVTAGPLPPIPDPASSDLTPAARDTISVVAARAGLTLNERQFEQLCATAPLVQERIARIPDKSDWYAEPSNTFRH